MCVCCGDGILSVCSLRELLRSCANANLWIEYSYLLPYFRVYSIHLMVVGGIRGLERSCPHFCEFGLTQTRTLSTHRLDRLDGSMLSLRHLNAPEAIMFAFLLVFETLLLFVVLGCIVGRSESPFSNVSCTKSIN